jgi:hypothetical protein
MSKIRFSADKSSPLRRSAILKHHERALKQLQGEMLSKNTAAFNNRRFAFIDRYLPSAGSPTGGRDWIEGNLFTARNALGICEQ